MRVRTTILIETSVDTDEWSKKIDEKDLVKSLINKVEMVTGDSDTMVSFLYDLDVNDSVKNVMIPLIVFSAIIAASIIYISLV